jgi:hypothetical protein
MFHPPQREAISMTKLSVRSIILLALALLIAIPAFADKAADQKKEAEKRAKEAKVKAVEEKIHHLHDHEKSALKGIDERYAHTIRSLDPKEVHHQLEEILVELRKVQDSLPVEHNPLQDDGIRDGLDYGGYRIKAHASIEKADHQVERALKHDTPEERGKAAHDIGAVHEDLNAALIFSREHPLDGHGKTKDELERRAVENQRLTDALPQIEQAHHLLSAVDHEIKDYDKEKNDLRKKRDQEKKETRERIQGKIKQLEEQLNALKK